MNKYASYYDGTFDQDNFDKEHLATKDQDGLMSKEDKAKLDELTGAGESATTVEAANAVEDATHRFVTDEEKTAWNDQVKRSEMGVPSGVATLDESGLIPSAQLPGFVDDVVEYDAMANFPAEGESGKIYVDTTENKSYRWSGSQYVEITAGGIALGETSATAYAGDKGKATTDAVNAIVDGMTVVPKAADAATVGGFTVGVNVPADAVFTDTVYEHPETHEASMIVETADKKFATEAQLAKVDAIPEDAKYTDTVYEHPETHEAAMIVETEEKRFVSDEQINAWDNKVDPIPRIPYYDEADEAVYACGVGIIVDASETVGMLTIKWVDTNGENTIEVPEGATIFGGGDGKEMPVHYPATSIMVNGGTTSTIYGGNRCSGSVGHATVIVNNVTFKPNKGIHAGGQASDSAVFENITGYAEVIINNTENEVLVVYGGGQGLAVVGSSKITVNGGTINYITAGGSNGHTGNAELVINGGTMKVLQGCNRGTMGNIKITVNDGIINKAFAGGETGDATVTATYAKSEMYVNGGTIGAISAGTNGGVESAENVAGEYVEGVIADDVAAAMNLVKAPVKFTDVVLEGTALVFKNGDVVVKSVDLASINA